MKKLSVLMVGVVTAVMSVGLLASTAENDIAKRIEKVGTVCVEGNDCASASSTVAVAAADAGGGEATYHKTCATCHSVGIAGAPKFGDAASWKKHIDKGMDALYHSAIHGLPPGMPAKGMCFTCSDDDLKAAVDFMVNSTK